MDFFFFFFFFFILLPFLFPSWQIALLHDHLHNHHPSHTSCLKVLEKRYTYTHHVIVPYTIRDIGFNTSLRYVEVHHNKDVPSTWEPVPSLYQLRPIVNSINTRSMVVFIIFSFIAKWYPHRPLYITLCSLNGADSPIHPFISLPRIPFLHFLHCLTSPPICKYWQEEWMVRW